MNGSGKTGDVTADREIELLAGQIAGKWMQSAPGRSVRAGSVVQSMGRGRTRVVALETRRSRQRPHPDHR
jgi:hypothetical protein